MPVSIGVQWDTESEAKGCRRGDLELAFCSSCGFIWNQNFDPSRLEYSQRYDNSLDFSPVFQTYARQLANRLIETYNIRNKDVVELGCGKGHFLTLLCESGDNRGIGFDPSYEGARMPSSKPGQITYIQDFYSERYTEYRGDLICCRHVFEHIPDPVSFLGMVRRTIGERESAVIYFEVPNVRFILQQMSIWDIIYEHCNYFSRESLAHTFEQCGFDTLRNEESYGGQFLSLDARLGRDFGDEPAKRRMDVDDLARCVKEFSEKARLRSKNWNAKLEEFQRRGQRTIVWGAGAKTVSFLNMLEMGASVSCVVDINPHKQGRFLPGTGQQIVDPAFLRKFRPDNVILMNPIYREEVEVQLSSLGVVGEVIEA